MRAGFIKSMLEPARGPTSYSPRNPVRVGVTLLALCICSHASPSDWVSAPQPKFPGDALKKGSEGSVRLRIVLTSDGRAKQAVIVRSSGDLALDDAAEKAVMKWRMKPTAIKPSDLTKGRDELIEFKQEPLIAARYPDRTAYFTSKGGAVGENELSKLWMFAPFPSYSLEARQQHEQGTVLVRLTIAKEGNTQNIRLLKSSGFKDLDDAALRAVSLWRAHKQYVGREVTVPVRFVMGRRR
jgi:TonB family protein